MRFSFLFTLLVAFFYHKGEVFAQSTPYVQQQEVTVNENLHSGKVLVLSDGSTWELAPQSLEVSQTWIFPSPLRVDRINHPHYPYKITSIETHSYVLARPIAPYETGGLDIQGS